MKKQYKGKKRGRKRIEVDLKEARYAKTISEAARMLRVSRRTLLRRMKEEGIEKLAVSS